MARPPGDPSPDNPNETSRRLSSDESLWDQDPGQEPAPAPAPVARTPPRRPQPLWRRSLRVNLLLAGGAATLLLLGFLLGLAVAGSGSQPPAAVQPPSVPTAARPAATVTSVVAGPEPRPCRDAVEWADKAISYLVANIRDERLSRAVQEFVESRRACQQAVR
jgi:hypothetical protein